jgi:hypothetical protein
MNIRTEGGFDEELAGCGEYVQAVGKYAKNLDATCKKRFN